MRLPLSLAKDVKRIEQVIVDELSFEQEFLVDANEIDEKRLTLLPSLLLGSAKFGKYDPVQLEPVAAGLVLLDIGVKRHNRNRVHSIVTRWAIDSLLLISGDYCCSKGITIASKINISAVIGIMSQAIIDSAEAQIALDRNQVSSHPNDFEEYSDYWSKQASLFVAACRIGVLLGCVSGEISGSLMEFGKLVGIISRFSEENRIVSESRIKVLDRLESLAKEAKRSIKDLPENEYKSCLIQLPEELVSCN